MNGSNHSPNVVDITSPDLRRYMQSHREVDYALIDVRQPEEFLAGHIPGARLVPLGELATHAAELQELSGSALVFYCRSGSRSQRASAWASRMLRLPSVYNLVGGIAAWEGPALGEFPTRVTLDLTGSVETLLHQALDFEKGVHRLYEQIVSEHSDGPLGGTLSKLIEVEITHGRAVYELLRQHSTETIEAFEVVFDTLPGAVLENGVSFDVALAMARELGKLGYMALLELALEIELGAYDLYKSLSGLAPSGTARQVLADLAQQEKEHADLILVAIGNMAKDLPKRAVSRI